VSRVGTAPFLRCNAGLSGGGVLEVF